MYARLVLAFLLTIRCFPYLYYHDQRYNLAHFLIPPVVAPLIPVASPVRLKTKTDACRFFTARAIFLWAGIEKMRPISDTDYAKQLFAEYNVTVLSGCVVVRLMVLTRLIARRWPYWIFASELF
jgi:hypothetical protein